MAFYRQQEEQKKRQSRVPVEEWATINANALEMIKEARMKSYPLARLVESRADGREIHDTDDDYVRRHGQVRSTIKDHIVATLLKELYKFLIKNYANITENDDPSAFSCLSIRI